ncbi:PAS domain S-box protein [Nostoc sp. FACHB-152]|uniref:sensor histidine kinase n=1 Tax=unclassified Nostoc TaxID=2593658 RepID=UPI00168210ED|nr:MULTISPECIES: PAS domain S-box protein [unclassified Nostoc]MBD2449814.1 PAS domain S-box protein [Nostoc sp. FACHB-152]MBD2471607.1 PAS domain S-box protein [Nostoc sp. FACHB-145]
MPVVCISKDGRVDEAIKLLHKPDFPPEAIALLEKVAASLPGMIFQFRQQPDGLLFVSYVSSGSLAVCELEPETIQADWQKFYQLIHPQDINSFTTTLGVAFATLKPWHWEGRIITPSGKIKWIQAACQLETQVNGEIIGDGLAIDITDRKQTEEKLRASEARYQAILDAIPDLMFRMSRDGEYLDLKGEGAIALTKEEIVGKNMRDLLPNDIALIGQETITKTLDAGTLQTCEYQLPTPAGIRDYEARLVVSGPDEVLAIVRDITERKQAETSLRNLAQKFSKAFSCSPDPITISTLNEGRFIEVNDSFVRLSGYEQDEVIGHTAFELKIWNNKSDRNQLLDQLQTNGAIRNLEFAFRRKSGELLTTLLSADVIDLDGVPCILAINHDITARKQAEAQMRLAAQRDRLLTETLVRIRSSLNLEEILQTTVTEVRQFLQADRVFIGLNDYEVKAKTVAESVDSRYPSILGWTSEDKNYLQELKTILTTHRVRVVDDISQITASPKLKAHYQKFQTKATLAVPIMLGEELFGALIANQCSGPRHWQPIEIDLVLQLSEQLAIAIQQVRLYQELAQLNANLEHQVEERTAQLQQKMQELETLQKVKDVVLHTVAHDLRTSVMGNLMVFKNLLQNQEAGVQGCRGAEGKSSSLPFCSSAPLPENPHSGSSYPVSIPSSMIERMIQGNERQLGMINALLEIHSFIEQGVVLQRQQVHFNTLLESIIPDLQPLLEQNQATLENLVSADLPLVMADATQLQRVLLTLLIYSLQNNPPGLHFCLNATVEAGMIRIQIEHNGVAISKLDCDRFFDLYVRDPQAPCSTILGLKMYLSRQIIQAHGGEIDVISRSQRGLTFWFTLPVAS